MHLKMLRKYAGRHKVLIIILFIVMVLSVIFQLAGANIISEFIDSALNNGITKTLTTLAIAYICLAVGNVIVSVLISLFSQRIGWKATNQLRKDLVSHCLGLDIRFHKEKTKGELIEIIDEDVNLMFNFFSKMGVILLSNGLLFIGVMIAFYIEDYRMGIAETIFAFIVLFMLMKLKQKGVCIQKEDRSYVSKLFGFIGESIDNIEDIQGNGAKKYVFDRFNNITSKWLPIRVKSGVLFWSVFMVLLFLQALGYAITFILGTLLWKSNIITIGTIYLFYNYSKFVLQPLNQIQQEMQNLQKVGASLIRIEKLLNQKRIIKGGSVKFDTLVSNKDDYLEFDKVSFGYNQNETILSDISFKIKNGDTLGLIGKTGSGKTTLLRLIARLYNANMGSIIFNDYNIEDIDLNDLVKSIMYVTQDIQILDASFRNNIIFFNNDVEDYNILETIKSMGLSDWFNKFDKGLDTQIGHGGVELSVGEKQLLALIRGFIKNPKIILLDEVTAKLDLETERIIQIALESLLKDRMAIIIAHRRQTLRKINKAIIIEEGKKIESGKVSDLLKEPNSQFCKLMMNTELGGLIYE